MQALLFLAFLNIGSVAHASDSLPVKKIIYKLEVQTISGGNYDGYLKSIHENEIIYSGKEPSFGTSVPSMDKSISYNELETVRLKRKGAAGHTALTAGLVSFGTGALLGLLSGDDPPYSLFGYTAGEKALIFGFAAGSWGSALGALLGAIIYKKFTIGGDRIKFEQMRSTVLDKVYGKQKKQHAVK